MYSWFLQKKLSDQVGVEAYAYNPSTQEAGKED